MVKDQGDFISSSIKPARLCIFATAALARANPVRPVERISALGSILVFRENLVEEHWPFELRLRPDRGIDLPGAGHGFVFDQSDHCAIEARRQRESNRRLVVARYECKPLPVVLGKKAPASQRIVSWGSVTFTRHHEPGYRENLVIWLMFL